MAAIDGDDDRRAGPADDVADWSDLADERVLRSQLRRRVFRAILALPAIYRAPVMLRDIQGMSTEEASAMLQREGSDAEVAAAPRPVDSAQAAGRLRRRPVAAPAALRHVRHVARSLAADCSAEAVRATSSIALSSATRSRALNAGSTTSTMPAGPSRDRQRGGRVCAPPSASSGATKQLDDPARPARRSRSIGFRGRRGERVRARRPQRGDAGGEAPARRFVEHAASARSRPIVASSHGTTM